MPGLRDRVPLERGPTAGRVVPAALAATPGGGRGAGPVPPVLGGPATRTSGYRPHSLPRVVRTGSRGYAGSNHCGGGGRGRRRAGVRGGVGWGESSDGPI